MPKTMLQLDGEFIALMEVLEECDGEPGEAILAALEQIEQDLTAKAGGYINLYRTFKYDAQQQDDIAKHHGKRATSLAGRAHWLRTRLEAAMRMRKLDKLKTPYGTASLRAAAESQRGVEVYRAEDIPPAFMRPPALPEPDKAAIKAALLAGNTVAGCRLSPPALWLDIR